VEGEDEYFMIQSFKCGRDEVSDTLFQVNGTENNTSPENTPPVKHDGEYVLTTEGSKDFGEITQDIAKEIRRQAGKIRLRIGEQDTKTDKGYGESHIERPVRIKQIRSIGFNSARDFVQHVARNFDTIYPADGGSLFLYKHGSHDLLLVVKLAPSTNGDFYDIQTGYITRKGRIKKEPLWKVPTSGPTSEPERANTNQRLTSPNANSGNSDASNIAPDN
jgi:hypothetical protein